MRGYDDIFQIRQNRSRLSQKAMQLPGEALEKQGCIRGQAKRCCQKGKNT